MTVTNRTGKLTPIQHQWLLTPIDPGRVMKANSQSHLPAYDVAAHLTRIFGPGGWEKEIISIELVSERNSAPEGQKEKWSVTYRCLMRLTLKDEDGNIIATFEDGACGSANNQPQIGEAHDLAYKSAISYALKRCAAFGLGDQFGLSLYNKGYMGALIGGTLVGPQKVKEGTNIQAGVPVPQSLGNDENDAANQVDPATGEVLTPQAPQPQAPQPQAPQQQAQRPLEVPAGAEPRGAGLKRAVMALGWQESDGFETELFQKVLAQWAAKGLPSKDQPFVGTAAVDRFIIETGTDLGISIPDPNTGKPTPAGA